MAATKVKPDSETGVLEQGIEHHEHKNERQYELEGSSPFDLGDDPHRAALEDNPEVAEIPSWSTLLAVLFLGLSFVAPVSIGFTMVASVVFHIATDLGDDGSITWMIGSWSIASSVTFSLAGSLSDVFGRRYLIIAGNLVSLVGAIIGGTAKSAGAVIAAMTMLGAGCGFVWVGYAGIAELVPNKYRGIGLGFTEFCIIVPFAGLGVLLGNLLTANVTWRWIFYLAVIYAAVCLIGVSVFYFPPRRPQADYQKSRWQEIKEIDYVGLILYTGGLASLLIGLTWAGSAAHPWKSVSVIVPIVVGLATLGACFAYDFTVPKNPLFPSRLFRNVRGFTLLLSFVFVAGMLYFTMAALLPQAALYLFTKNPTEVGVISIPGGLAQVLGGFILPSLVHKIKHIKVQIITGLIVQTVFTACYSAAIPSSRSAWMALQFFAQGAFPFVTVLCYVAAGLNVRQRDLGVASGLIGTFRSAGGSVGNAIFNTILNSYVNKRLAPSIAAAAIAQGFPAHDLGELIPAVIETGVGVPGAFAKIPSATMAVQAATAQAFKDTYVYAFRHMFWCAIPFGVIAIIAACFLNDPSIYLTNHVAVHMEKEVIKGQARETKESKGGV